MPRQPLQHRRYGWAIFRFLRWVALGISSDIVGMPLLFPPAASQSLLMVGNSYTSSNNLPSMVRSMLSEVHENVVVERYAPGGRTLDDHVSATQSNTGLRRWLVTDPLPWTWVILQEQSQTGGLYEFVNFDFSLEAARTLNALVSTVGAETVFFQTWGRRDGDGTMPFIFPDFLTMNEKLRIGYKTYVQETSTFDRPTRLAPVGDAFEYLFRNPNATLVEFRSLYTSDGSHPSVAGTYLSACVIFAILTGKDPRQVVYVPNNLNGDVATELQTVAHIVRSQNTHFPAMESTTPSPVTQLTTRPTQRPTSPETLRPTTVAPSNADSPNGATGSVRPSDTFTDPPSDMPRGDQPRDHHPSYNASTDEPSVGPSAPPSIVQTVQTMGPILNNNIPAVTVNTPPRSTVTNASSSSTAHRSWEHSPTGNVILLGSLMTFLSL